MKTQSFQDSLYKFEKDKFEKVCKLYQRFNTNNGTSRARAQVQTDSHVRFQWMVRRAPDRSRASAAARRPPAVLVLRPAATSWSPVASIFQFVFRPFLLFQTFLGDFKLQQLPSRRL